MQNFVPWKDKTQHIDLTQEQRSGLGFVPKLLLVAAAGTKPPTCCSFPVFLGHAASCGCLNTKVPAKQSSAPASLHCVNSFYKVRRQISTTASSRESLIVLGSCTACTQKSLALELSVCGNKRKWKLMSVLRGHIDERDWGRKEREGKGSLFMCLRWLFIVTFLEASAFSHGWTKRPVAI